MTKLALILTAISFLAIGCVVEEAPDEVGEAEAALYNDNINSGAGDVNKNLLEQTAYSNLNWTARRESDGWNWKGPSSYSGAQDYYGGGYCWSYSWGNRCNSSRDTWLISPGWGQNFQDYWNQPGESGSTVLGQHPYWCSTSGGGTGQNTWHGWSLNNQCN